MDIANIAKVIEKDMAEIENNLQCLQIDFNDDLWKITIPSQPGWYLIETTTPINVLKSLDPPRYKAHINIPKTIESASILLNLGVIIVQSANDYYVVYNGEASNLNARAREHVRGHEKTFCLGLVNYPILKEYSWKFSYVLVSSCKSIVTHDKTLRVLFEQAWRGKHGWPILCKK